VLVVKKNQATTAAGKKANALTQLQEEAIFLA